MRRLDIDAEEPSDGAV
ncbi:Protein of unknown function [Propionibacterium freudenreichii]|nr:Protein of unknown function [Propionibacterium freudenreichii]